ncbi:hypothetical protein ACISK3_12755 [Morganella morganii]|nr:hypothetical protein [Morganella morganii]
MFPNSSYYLKSHLRSAKKPIMLASVVLSLCFINNQNNIGFFDLYAGVLSIFLVIVINLFSNSKAYWIYCVFSKKFNINYTLPDNYKYFFFIKNKKVFLSFYIAVCFLIIYIISFFLFVEIRLSQELIILILGFMVLPLLLMCFMKVLSEYNLNESLIYLNNHADNDVRKKKMTIGKIIFIEILASIFTNLFIVPPILERKSFLLINNGLGISFIVSMIILLYSILIVMLFLSKNKRMYVLMGFVLLQEIDTNENNFKKPKTPGKILTFLIIPPFVVITSFLFSFIHSPYNAAMIYLLCLIPVYFIYYRIRMKVLHNDLLHAFDMVLRLNALNSSIK